MTDNELNESKFEEVSVKNDFNWFEGDLYDTFESPIEDIKYATFDTAKIDELATIEDYMEFQHYLDQLRDEDKHKALEYVENNYPEFLKDEEWNLIEPMKWWSTNKELADDLENKPDFDKNIIKDELTKNLLKAYKNAA